MASPRVVVVTKYTSYRHLLELSRNDEMLKPLLARGVNDRGTGVAYAKQAAEEHKSTLRQVVDALRDLGASTQVISLPHQPFSVRGVSVVVTVGGDGTLLAASHQCDGHTPIVGVNSAPSSSVGFFCGIKPGRLLKASLRKALDGTLPGVELARMEVRVNRKVISRRILNDALFCHPSPAATSRYIVMLGDDVENHKSSGFWVGPAAGSTAAQYSAGGQILPMTSRDIQFVVRNPYQLTGKLRFARSVVGEGNVLVIYNRMREAKLFLDGPHSVVDVGLGSKLQFMLSPEPIRVLGLSANRGRTRNKRDGLGSV